jgi:hypothetical protein|tara:strand:- start:1382 stop:2026 length:645 start_codon:yes stop_codon:yes gene_type:complete
MRIVKLKIDDKATEFKLPTSWDEVSVAQYSKLMLAIEKEGTTEIELMIKSLEALVGIDGGILSRVPIKMLREAYKQLGELTSNMPSNELSRVVEIDGIEYGIIPDFNELTLGEFVDLDNYLQDNYNNLNKIFAVLYRPVIERDGNNYNIEPYSLKNISDRRELFNNRLSIDTVYGALVFFCSIGSKHIESTLYSLEEEKMSQSIIKSSQIKEIV